MKRGSQQAMTTTRSEPEIPPTADFKNFSVENFSIREHGSLIDVAEAAAEQYELDDTRPNDGQLL